MIERNPKRGTIKEVEVRGEVLVGVIEGMGVFKNTAMKLLSEYGISEPKAGSWYPLESLIFVFNKLADEGGINEPIRKFILINFNMLNFFDLT